MLFSLILHLWEVTLSRNFGNIVQVGKNKRKGESVKFQNQKLIKPAVAAY